ncbi:lycopene cyclase domain-containing protein [Leucobacter rhizosphaerae]|uniref:Lycopene cyclase domain-containing protein n=1 Tax=Leucobacter rhizosphaerae TaxID=2932245 RepID=A0ABY4FT23_9MICO|nr:lycopene cyclase domain-containing protein [Leucobacter rhizosphaerae]UOQ59412.1 lycopene cyclase domain-containing protein [Leucobacter rhizosphaerae]
MGMLYLGLLLGGIACMLLLDRRFSLFFWHDPAVALLVTAVGTALFLVWDLAGIAAGVFFRGEGVVASGIVLAPELPLEEPVFLIFLVLCTMVVFTGSARIFGAMRDRRSADGDAAIRRDANRRDPRRGDA